VGTTTKDFSELWLVDQLYIFFIGMVIFYCLNIVSDRNNNMIESDDDDDDDDTGFHLFGVQS